MDLHVLFGIGLVDDKETKEARLASRIFTIVLACCSIMLLLEWHGAHVKAPYITARINSIMLFVVWLLFIFETVVLIYFVNDKKKFIARNYLNFFIIIGGLFAILNVFNALNIFLLLQPIIALVFLLPWFFIFVSYSLAENRLRITLFTVIAVIFVAGILISAVDPTIKTPWEGFWWAWVTISTVGYGDYVPVSLIGRIIASVLIFFGLGFFAILAANFSALFLGRDVRSVKRKEGDILSLLKKLETMHEDQHKIMLALNRLDSRIKDLESGFVAEHGATPEK
jgi:voltage-gated potassium channel